MKLEQGKKYNTIGAGVGTAKRLPEYDDVTALYFNDDETPYAPICYYDEDEGRSNITFVTTKYDVTGEYTE